jgi:hypothetical protein
MSSDTDTIRVVKHLQNPAIPGALKEAPMDELSQETWGVIQGLSLPSLLQMLNMERKTCTIRVSSERRNGFFYLRDGQIINACYRGLDGMDAVQALIAVPSPKMEIDKNLHDPTQRLDLRLEEILLLAAQLQDEGNLAIPPGPAVNLTDESDAIPMAEVGKWGEPEPSPRIPARSGFRHPGRLLSGLFLVLMLAGGAWLLIPRAVAVEIQSSPSGATVSLDGAFRGTTPLRLTLPSPPKGTLTLTLPGHQPYQRALQPADRRLSCILQASPVPVVMPSFAPADLSIPTGARKLSPKTKAKPRHESPTPSRSDIFDQLRKGQE